MSISLYQAAVQASEDLHLTDNSEYVWFMKKAQNAARKIKCLETVIQECCQFEVDNEGRVCMPHGTQRILAVRICQDPDCTDPSNPIRQPGGLLYYMDTVFLKECGINTGNWVTSSRRYDFEGNTLQLYGFRNCKADVAYMGYNIDENGHMRIRDEWEEAIVFYLCREYAVAYKFPQNIINDYSKSWVAAVRGIKSESQMVQLQSQKAKIQSIMSSYLPRRNIYNNL